jgi:hypothetical protein
LDRRRFDGRKLIGLHRLAGGIQQRRRQGDQRGQGRFNLRRRGRTQHKSYEQSNGDQRCEGKTDAEDDPKDRSALRFGQDALQICPDRRRRNRIRNGILRRRQRVPPSGVWLLASEQDEAP